MTTIPPPAAPPVPPPAALPRTLPAVSLAAPSAELLKLAAGARFEGTVVADGTAGAVRVETAYGTLQILTTLPLGKGARLNLVLQNLTQPLQLQIAAIDGKPPPAFPGLRAAPAGTAGAAGPSPVVAGPAAAVPGAAGVAPTPAPVPPGLVGSSLTAVLIRPAIPSAPLVYGPAPSAGAAMPATGGGPIVGPSSPTAPLAPAAAPASPTPPSAATVPAPSAPGVPALTPFTGGLPPMVPGTLLVVRIVAINPAPADPAAVPGGAPAAPSVPATPLAGQTMTAVVAGATPAGRPVVSTPAGTFMLNHPTPLPRGAELRIEIESAPLPPPAAGAPAPLPAATLFKARAWPALVEALQALQEGPQGAAHPAIAAHLPQPNARLTADVLFFLSALRGGDLGGWLTPEAAGVLRRERPELLNRLGEEFRQLGVLAREPAAGDWRTALVPFLAGADLEPLRLLVRPYGGEDEAGGAGPKGVRFIVDVDLSRLGRMQLDGLVRDDKKRFDLIIRSDRPLPAAMQNDIRDLFEEAVALTRVAGGLSFQAAPAHFVDVAPRDGGPDAAGLFA